MREVSMNDHEFSAFLLENCALHNFEKDKEPSIYCQFRTTKWMNFVTGETVAVAIYDNRNCTRKIFVN